MIYTMNLSGGLTNISPANVYQGSAIDKVIVASPLASNNVLTITYELPNGVRTQPTASSSAIYDEQLKFNVWVFDLAVDITAIHGVVKFQITSNNGLKSEEGTFVVQKGIPPVLPLEPTSTIYDQILDNLSAIYYQLTPIVETFSLSSWQSLSDKLPFKYKATVTATAVELGDNAIVNLMADDVVVFAKYGFAIGEISEQEITFYAINEPTEAVELTVLYKEVQ